MPTLKQLPNDLRKLLFGRPFGEKFPEKANPDFPSRDGRTVAIDLLGDYVASLRFMRPGAPGQPPIPFSVAREHFYTDWPESVQVLRTADCACAVTPAKAEYEVIGLTTFLLEETRDVFARGTVLQWQACYKEPLTVEFWVATKAHARSVKAGFEIAMWPVEQMAGIRFAMPRYFGQLATFMLGGCEVVGDEMAGRGRRRVRFSVELRYNVVSLVNYASLTPQVQVTTDVDVQTGVEVAETDVDLPDGS